MLLNAICAILLCVTNKLIRAIEHLLNNCEINKSCNTYKQLNVTEGDCKTRTYLYIQNKSTNKYQNN